MKSFLATSSRFTLLACLLTFAAPCFGRQPTNAPSVISQPVSQVADYGSDVSFSVSVSAAAPVTYQWQKNGENLIDYENVAGSQTGTLTLVGVAGNDVGNYQAIIGSAGGGSVTSSVAALTLTATAIFSDTFENGFSNWNTLLNSTNGLGVTTQANHTPGGNGSLAMTNAAQKAYHNLPVQYDCRTIYSFWFYDDGGTQMSCGGELRGYSGPGYGRYKAPGGLRQILAIGKVNAPFPTNNTGTFAGETLDPTQYQGRILRGTNAGWFNLNAPRSVGWHYFRIDRSAAGSGRGTVSFYVDGFLAGVVNQVHMAAVDSLFLGSLEIGETENSGTAYFDDVTVEAFPGLFEWQNLANTSPILDWIQYRETGTNWQVVNVTPSTISSVNGAATNAALGTWVADGTALYSAGMRGYVEYGVNTFLNGAYRIEIEGRERNYRTPVVAMPVEVFIDGESLGRLNLPYSSQTNGCLHCFTPYLQAGSHTIRLYWDNVDPRRSLLIQSVRLHDLLGTDAGNGLQAWVVNRLVAQNGLEVCPSTSLVSPVCVEGRGQYLSMMSLLAGPTGALSTVPVQPGAGHRWYANVPLSPTTATLLLASYQNGGYWQSNEMVWLPSNLLSLTNNITLRLGDSLLLNAVPDQATNGAVTLAIGNLTNITSDAFTPVPYQFNQTGTFIVTGTYVPTGASGSIAVTVVNASFEDSPIAKVFFARFWECTNLPPGVVLDADPRLKVNPVSDAERAQRTPALLAKGVNERDFRIRTRSVEPQYVLARLGVNGPVVASTAVRGFRWSISPDTYLQQIKINMDDSQIVETAFVEWPVFTNFTASAQVISSGVTFDDGTVTKAFSAQDFDATGVCVVRFIHPALAKGSTCHTTKLYDNGALIGWR